MSQKDLIASILASAHSLIGITTKSGMDLATVMGPAGMQLPAAEELQVSEIPADQMVALRGLLKKAGKKSLTQAEINEYKDKIATEMNDMAKAHAQKMAGEYISQYITTHKQIVGRLKTGLTVAQNALKKVHDDINVAAKKIGDTAQSVSLAKANGKTAKAAEQKKTRMETLGKIMLRAMRNTSKINTLEDAIQNIEDAEDFDVTAENQKLDDLNSKLESLQKRQGQHTKEVLLAYGKTAAKEKDKIVPLEVTSHLKSSTLGRECIQSVCKHMFSQVEDFPLSYCLIDSMRQSYNPTNGKYEMPDITSLSDELQMKLKAEGKILYDSLDEKLPRSIMTDVKSLFNYGKAPQSQYKVQEDDGVMLVFAILALYTRSDDKIETEIRDAAMAHHEKYRKGDPMKVTDELKQLLEKAELYCVPLEWSMTGEPIINMLRKRGDEFITGLLPYQSKGESYQRLENKSDCASLLEEL